MHELSVDEVRTVAGADCSTTTVAGAAAAGASAGAAVGSVAGPAGAIGGAIIGGIIGAGSAMFSCFGSGYGYA